MNFPLFQTHRFWRGQDLQTLKNFIVPPILPALMKSCEKKMVFPMLDGTGDCLTGVLTVSTSHPNKPFVILIHGLSGSEESAYMIASAAHWFSCGYPVLRLNLRGSIPTQPCYQTYHAGRDEDLAVVLDHLSQESFSKNGFVLIGFSLGGNMLMKFLAQYGKNYHLKAAITVSAPIDLAKTSQRFLKFRNRVYHWWILRHVKFEALNVLKLKTQDRKKISKVRTIYELDDLFTAPRNGFKGADDYYQNCSGINFLKDIQVPTLVVHALDDPWIPSQSYTEFDWSSNKSLIPLLQKNGGHVGFHDIKGTWHNRMASDFADYYL